MKKRLTLILCCLCVCLTFVSCDDMKPLESKGTQSATEQPQSTPAEGAGSSTEANTTKDKWTNNY